MSGWYRVLFVDGSRFHVFHDPQVRGISFVLTKASVWCLRLCTILGAKRAAIGVSTGMLEALVYLVSRLCPLQDDYV